MPRKRYRSKAALGLGAIDTEIAVGGGGRMERWRKLMPEAFVVTPETTPTPLNVVGEHITLLAPGSRTGSYEIFRQAGPEGSGPHPHFTPQPAGDHRAILRGASIVHAFRNERAAKREVSAPRKSAYQG
jgi:hypothetical protein